MAALVGIFLVIIDSYFNQSEIYAVKVGHQYIFQHEKLVVFVMVDFLLVKCH